jgi:hypothetical protein
LIALIKHLEEFFCKILRFFSLNAELIQVKRILPKYKYKKDNKIILVEAWQTPWNQLGLSLFLKEFVAIFGGKPTNYYFTQRNFWFQIKEFIRHRFSLSYRYGIKNIIFFGPKNRNKAYFMNLAAEILSKIATPQEFECLKVRGVRIGDLVYDHYLRAAKSPTLNLQDPILLEKLSDAIAYLEELEDFFKNNQVIAVCVSHTVYNLAIASRLACKFDIQAFQVTGQSIYRLSNTNSHAYTDFKDYKSLFESLPRKFKDLGIKEASKRIEKRLNGVVGVDMTYSTLSAYSINSENDFEFKGDGKVKVLVAIHDFYDSPHAYGDNLFPDFKIWLDFLADIATDTDYNWYLKTHPDVIGDGEEIIARFSEENFKFQVIPKNISHHKLIEHGVNVVLTIFGTISAEYSYLGKLAINASVNNPHSSFEFSLTPKNLSEYKDTLLNLEKLVISHIPKKQDVLEFYLMHNIFRLNSWTIRDVDKACKDLGGFSQVCSWKVFKYFYEDVNSYKKTEISRALSSFINGDSQAIGRLEFDNLYDF